MKTKADLMRWVVEAEEAIKGCGFEELTTRPYGYPMKPLEIVCYCRDNYEGTAGSKRYILRLANAFNEILMAWIKNQAI